MNKGEWVLMKRCKRPTLRQKKLMNNHGLNPIEWRIQRETPSELVLIYRYTDHTRTIYKGA